MANRYTDTTIWKKQKWFKKLPPIYKLAWKYITDECNHAGIWKIDMSEFLDDIGIESFDLKDFITLCNKDFDKLTGKDIKRQRIIQITTDRLWITGFITFQYGGKDQKVKTTNNIIKSAIELLKTFKIFDLAVNNQYIIFEDLSSVPKSSEDLGTLRKGSEDRRRAKDKEKDIIYSLSIQEEVTKVGEIKLVKSKISMNDTIDIFVYDKCEDWQYKELVSFITMNTSRFEQIRMTKQDIKPVEDFKLVLQEFVNKIQSTGEYQESSLLSKHFGNWIGSKNGTLGQLVLSLRNTQQNNGGKKRVNI